MKYASKCASRYCRLQFDTKLFFMFLLLQLFLVASGNCAGIELSGNVKISGGSLYFPDGTYQSTATMKGDTGPQGPQGPQGPAGSSYSRTIMVSPVGTDAVASGTVLMTALNGITDAADNKRYLLKIEPGYYDIEANKLDMKEYVDIEGSGENMTIILGSIPANGTPPVNGVITSSTNYSEIRQLKVIAAEVGILANAGKLVVRNVSINNTGYADFYGIYNRAYPLKIENVTINGGPTNSISAGIKNEGTATIKNSTISASAVLGYAYGIYNKGTLAVNNSDITAQVVMPGGSTSIAKGIYNFGASASATLDNVPISAFGYSTLGNTFGLHNDSAGNIILKNSKIIASGGENVTGISNGSTTKLELYNTDIATGACSWYGTGIGNSNSNVSMYNSTIKVPYCPTKFGLDNQDVNSKTITIVNSVINASTKSINLTGNSLLRVANSQLAGTVFLALPVNVQCLGTYNENFASLNSTCQ